MEKFANEIDTDIYIGEIEEYVHNTGRCGKCHAGISTWWNTIRSENYRIAIFDNNVSRKSGRGMELLAFYRESTSNMVSYIDTFWGIGHVPRKTKMFRLPAIGVVCNLLSYSQRNTGRKCILWEKNLYLHMTKNSGGEGYRLPLLLSELRV